jgi:hypothetical protein
MIIEDFFLSYRAFLAQILKGQSSIILDKRARFMLCPQTKLFLSTVFLLLILVSSVSTFSSTAQAAELTAKQKSINILNSVIGLDMSKCNL